MSVEWHSRSFFLEVKPRQDLASLFVDCPPNGDGEDKENNCLDVVRVSENAVELGLPSGVADHVTMPPGGSSVFRARISGLSLFPDSVCSPTWADNRRLFMCKVRTGTDDNKPITPKQFHRLAKEMSPCEPLEEFVASAEGAAVEVTCKQCQLVIVPSENGSPSLGFLPADDWLTTSPSVEFYCRDSCGAACDPHKHGHGAHSHRGGIESEGVHLQWLPKKDRVMISHSYTVVHRDSVDDRVVVEDKNIFCGGCHSQIGMEVRNQKDLLQLHHSICEISVGGKSYLEHRFPIQSMFYTQLLLTSCEAKSSLKLVIRTLDKAPQLLVWLLDSYVILAAGDLRDGDEKDEDGNEESVTVKPFPAIKMLYKVFDAQSAASDPRANGEDASVGLVDLPLPCCVQVTERLLLSSHCLPPACRSVGQFYVGFLPLSDSI